MIVEAKDSLINAVFGEINDIAENLTAIRTREHLITIGESPEGGKRPIDNIRNNIQAIDLLLEQNRAKIESLQNTASLLRKANLQIGELEKTIDRLNQELLDKSSEIALLNAQLDEKNGQISSLLRQLQHSHDEMEQLHDERISLEAQLNAVYYIVGSEKELREAKVLDKQGVIGRTLTVSDAGSLNKFNRSDARVLREIPIGQKRVTLVTSHPKGSYQLVTDADKKVVKLVIDNPEQFWAGSKILVISYK